MKMKKLIATLFILFGVASYSAIFEAGFISPMQLQSPNTDIQGIRVGLIYTDNDDVEGIDVNLIANSKRNFTGLSIGSFYDETRGDFTGVRIPWFGFAAYNRVEGNLTGIQLGGVNHVMGQMQGFQLGIINLTETAMGLQVGGFNKASYFKGLQVGFVNYARRLDGLQIGLVNIADNSQVFEVLPLANWNFRF